RTCDRLFAAGVGPGDRVALCLRKSIDTVAAIVGILEAGAAYVPLDSTAPAERNARILADASVTAAIVEREWREALAGELPPDAAVVTLDDPGNGDALRRALEPAAGHTHPAAVDPDSPAYILYTSGSTGMPKGVMVSHRAAAS